jgi:tight adherence protein B
MPSELESVYVIYLFVGVSAIFFAEAIYLLFFSATSYRKRVNRRLSMLNDGDGDRQNLLVMLRRERGLNSEGNFRLPILSFNRLILQSGVTLGVAKLALFIAFGAAITFGAVLIVRGNMLEALGALIFAGIIAPFVGLRYKRSRRQQKFGEQFADAIDIIVRSLKAGHPVPVAVTMVGREMPDPIGTEFGIVSDEITYGADLETAMRSLYFRVGQDDLPLFVTAVAIQGSTGGNLGEILANLSAVIRLRFKMKRKVKALASEARASAMILSSLPIAVFSLIQFVSPEFYGNVWQFDLTKIVLTGAGAWMGLGNFIMYRMVNFKF